MILLLAWVPTSMVLRGEWTVLTLGSLQKVGYIVHVSVSVACLIKLITIVKITKRTVAEQVA